MKKLLTVILTLVLLLSCSTVCFAAEESDTYTADVYAKYIGNSAKTEIVVPDGADEIKVQLPDGTEIVVEDIPDDVYTLVIFPIPADEKEAHAWFTEVTSGKGTEIAPYEIYFVTAAGDKLVPNGAEITMGVPDSIDQPIVLAVDKNNTVTELATAVKDGKITFTADDSDYYVLAEKVIHSVKVEDTNGGDVEIDKENPETGEDVTITPDPDDGKVVDKVVVKDEDGNEISVIDNGDGTYTYEQPDGDVTIEVTFKDKIPTDSPQTGDNTLLWPWLLLLILSAMGIVAICYEQRRNKAVK